MPRAPISANVLEAFEPGVRRWFDGRFPGPTAIQSAAWPVIAAGEHVLVTAPTGSGKTLTAFLWALNRFAAGQSAAGGTRVLYVSPLKALNNDIQRNLLTPLTELAAAGAVPAIRVETRSGDTPQSERQRMLRRPPEILVTTPESLGLLLTTTRGRHALATVETVILDEVHALADNRRGTLLLVGLERLVHLAGDFQRIALSATVRPLEEVAAYVAGADEAGVPRPMRVLEAPTAKEIALTVRFPAAARDAAASGTKIWKALAGTFRETIAGNRATLFFTNSRRLAERLTAAINEDQPEPLAYAHHGSLSREIRLEVEARLKSGALKAIVATSSLEMGIDIGALDEVVMIQSPPTIAAALQRIGRAGHQVGEVSRGALFPTHAQDFVEAAALTEAVADRDIEPLTPLANPLDVLCQIVVSMAATEPWTVDGMFALLRRSGPYRTLPRTHYDLVLEMLAGRYAGTRVRELAPRIAYDRIRGTVQAQHAAVLALYNSGGVIPDRGYFQIRHLESGAVIGELDEEFVWEATIGQVFSLGTQNWQIHRITHNDVVVRPTARQASAPPFWRADTSGRSFHYSQRIGAFLELAEARLAADQAPALVQELIGDHDFEPVAAEELVEYLLRQRQATGTPLPHRRHLLAERILAGPGGYRGPDQMEQLVLHTGWGRRVNRPWSLALGAALTADGARAELHVDENAVVIQSREPIAPDRVLRLVTSTNLEPLLRRSLESSGFFGARFREAAGRALLLGRQRFNTRLPLWMSRLQAKKLMTAVKGFSDFPVLLETWRTCLDDEFDLGALTTCLAEIEDGSVAVSTCVTTSPSPFAANSSFGQINRYVYATDRPEQPNASALSDELILSAVFRAELRPRLESRTVEVFEAKRQRIAPGYAPDTADDWAEWVKERVLLPANEATDVPPHPYIVHLTDGERFWLCHRELLAALTGSGLAAGVRFEGPAPDVGDPRNAEQLALEMLSFYGPLTATRIESLLPRIPAGLLDDDQSLIRGPLMEGDETLHYCDPDNFEALLRLQRALRRPRVEPRPVTDLPGVLAAWQGLPDAGDAETALETLRGHDTAVGAWLYDLPAARIPAFEDHRLDRAVAELGLAWQGTGPGRIRLGYPEDLALLEEPRPADPEISALFADPRARYPFLHLGDRQAAPLAELNDRWWRAVWNGQVSADTLAPLRQGAARDYRISGTRPARAAHRRGRPRIARSTFAADPWPGTWFLLQPDPPQALDEAPGEAMLELEDAKERARLLLDRYGLACREIANREGGRQGWSALFRALRLMELAGEVVAGYFFDGLSGPQFVPPSALTLFQSPQPAPPVFWCSAVDPVSPCGLGVDWPELPQRRLQNHLAFAGGALALVAENLGKRLQFFVPPERCEPGGVLAPLEFLLARHRRLTIDSVNGTEPRRSPYLPALERIGKVRSDHRSTWLEAP